jgi:amino acid transporter
MVVGVKESSLLNKLFTLLNIFVIMFIFVSGVVKSDLSNWKLNPQVYIDLFNKKISLPDSAAIRS